MENKIRSILFVCTGNSCRSVMAEGLMKAYLRELGKGHITVQSAGIMAVGGMAPTDETCEVMEEEGIDVSRYISKHITDNMVKNTDLILTMEEVHKNAVVGRMPDAVHKTYLLQDYGRDKGSASAAVYGHGIPDPIGQPLDYYRQCLSVIKKEVRRVAGLL